MAQIYYQEASASSDGQGCFGDEARLQRTPPPADAHPPSAPGPNPHVHGQSSSSLTLVFFLKKCARPTPLLPHPTSCALTRPCPHSTPRPFCNPSHRRLTLGRCWARRAAASRHQEAVADGAPSGDARPRRGMPPLGVGRPRRTGLEAGRSRRGPAVPRLSYPQGDVWSG